MTDILIELKKLSKEDTVYSSIAKYLLSYKGDFNTLTASMICDNCYCSSPTITRLAQKLNLSGFSELKVILKNELKYENVNNEILNNYKQVINKTIDSTLQSVSYDNLIIASNLIHNAKSVSLFGIGGSKNILNDFYGKLLRLNFNITNEIDLHFQHVVATNMTEDDVAIVITYSGKTKEILNIIDILKTKKCKIIIISANENLEDKNVLFLKLNKSENYSRVYSLTSRMSIEVILDFLFLEILQNDNMKYDNIFKTTRIEKE